MTAASTLPHVSEEEYLRTSYDPDVEYVEGELVKRKMGNYTHGLLASLIDRHLAHFEKTHQFRVLPAVRLQVSLTSRRYRIPDLMIVDVHHKRGKVVTDVPLITIEIKSPDDNFDDVIEKCTEYEALGVSVVLILDPDHKRAWMFRDGELRRLASNTLDLPGRQPLPFPADELFSRLDD